MGAGTQTSSHNRIVLESINLAFPSGFSVLKEGEGAEWV